MVKQKDQASRIAANFKGQTSRPASLRLAVGEQPTQRFLKDLIAVGLYRHPVFEWELDVNTDRMDQWIGAFNRMQENGVDVEVVVDHRMDAEAVRGYLVAMFRGGTDDVMAVYPEADDPERLYGVHEMRGEDAIELAQTVRNVSVLIERDFKDGKGVSYGEAISHSSIVQQPVVPGQEGFVPVAASKGVNRSAPIFVLHNRSRSDNDRSDGMTIEELIEKMKPVLGAGDELTEENLLSRMTERLEASATALEERDKKIGELTADLETAKAASKGGETPEVPAETLDMLAEGVETKVESLVAAGKLTPEAATKAKAFLIGTGDKNQLALSRTVSGTPKSIAAEVLDILATNDPVKLGEQTKGQALSRQTPGDGTPDLDPDVTKEMIAEAGGPAE